MECPVSYTRSDMITLSALRAFHKSRVWLGLSLARRGVLSSSDGLAYQGKVREEVKLRFELARVCTHSEVLLPFSRPRV